MTEPDLVQLAQLGDPKAIANILNRSLQSKGITVKAVIKDSCLQLMVESTQIPPQKAVVNFVRKTLIELSVDDIKTVRISGQHIGMASPSWRDTFKLPEKSVLLADDNSEIGIRQMVKEGNVNAINVLLVNALANSDLTVLTELKNGCLQIILQSLHEPEEQATVEIIRQTVMGWQAENIDSIQIYGQQIHEAFPVWGQHIELMKRDRTDNHLEKTDKLTLERIKNFPIENRFQFSSIVPYKDAFSANLYKDNKVKLMLFFSLFPWTLRLLARETGLESIAWLLGIYYSAIWGIVLYHLIKPLYFAWGETIKCILFTAFVGIPLLLFVQSIPPFNLLYSALNINSLGVASQLVGFVFGVGILEESCKALPVYLFMVREGKINNPLTSAFYGAMSGLGFAIAEGANYSVMYAFGLQSGRLGLGDYVLVNTIRMVSLPLFHATWAGIVGYFLGLAAINPSRRGMIIAIGIAISAVLHGCYNTFSNNLLGFAILAFSILLFVAYLRRSKEMVDRMQQAELNYQSWKSK